MRHGRWPSGWYERGPALPIPVPTDPFTGDPLAFARRDGWIVIYSVGADRRDDGGITEAEARRRADQWAGGWDEATVGMPYAAYDPDDVRGDLTFELLDPELRGARVLTGREEAELAGYTWEKLVKLGLTEEELSAFGLGADDAMGKPPAAEGTEEGRDATSRSEGEDRQ
jgi:hypothetical protein